MRAVVEATYEPPQKGDFNGVAELDDKNRDIVDKVAAALDFTRVGWIFSTTSAEVFLSSGEALKVAEMQEKNCILHSSGAKISKFVSVRAKMVSEKGDKDLEAMMVSDQCQALVRDHIFEGVKDNSTLLVRKPKVYVFM